MTILGYSEIIKEIYGISSDSLESALSLLMKAKPNRKKITILKLLARKNRATVSELLRISNMNNTGGSFKAMTQFMDDLVSSDILIKEQVGRRRYYSFKDNADIKKWLFS